ncbi:MAG: MFS transporter [Bacteroidales bacterium]|nr:MFS transporter [Bacteroidales bacterium]
MAKTPDSTNKNLVLSLAIIGIIFFIIGFGIGISGFLTPALRSAFDLNTGQAYLVTAAIFSAFILFGRPSAWIINKIGYRKSLSIAFIIMAIGMLLFVPSARLISFPLFLFALFVGGIGNTLLQAAVNPYVTIIGSIDSAAMRMSLMGIMNKMAWWVAPLFLGIFIDLNNVMLDDVINPFYIVTAILIALGIAIYFAPLPEVKARGEEATEIDSSNLGNSSTNSIWSYPHLLLGTFAIFLYVGIEVLPMVSIIDFAKASFGDVPNLESYAKYVTIGLVAGYLFGVITVPRLLSQTTVLIIFAILGILSSLFLVFSPIEYAFYGLLFTSFANSLMWPAIWPLAIADLGKLTKIGSSTLVMGIVGGAFIPLIFGYLVDLSKGNAAVAQVSDYQFAYWILFPCYLFILYFALHGHRIRLKKITPVSS